MYTSTHASTAIREQPKLAWSSSFKKERIKNKERNEERKKSEADSQYLLPAWLFLDKRPYLELAMDQKLCYLHSSETSSFNWIQGRKHSTTMHKQSGISLYVLTRINTLYSLQMSRWCGIKSKHILCYIAWVRL